MSEKETYQEPEVTAQVQVKPTQKQYNYKTVIRFIDINRKHETVVSIQPPSLTPAGTLQFLKDDRLLNYERQGVVFSWETEQLQEIKQAHIVVGVTEK